ncbi:M23 family metallopeptidase [Paucibacter sp. XJ19-41]|uniref:M23 family metallopeptidase n=1 Tax=Paucibacter sp. XJ19-41 TaxID=2927824 RepID=UPI00234AA9D3|nr:M23 family metallopeptidase [Paucibacter sp. XJ19-41]MDC6166987.1 M23 family metallopeptidase [Paucibacter sp. XJ19-41]
MNRRQLLLHSTATILLPSALSGLSPHAAAASSGLEIAALDRFARVRMSRQDFLVGELSVRNTSAEALALRRLLLLGSDAASEARPLVTVVGDALQALANGPDGRPARLLLLGASEQVLLHLWQALPAGDDAGLALRLEAVRGDGSTGMAALAIPAAEPPLQLGPPLRGGPWAAVFDPWLAQGHRRSAFVHEGQRFIPARFAIDWIRLDAGGRPGPAGPAGYAQWHGLDSEVLAVADGEIVALRDGREDLLNAQRPARPWSHDDVAGNYLCLQLADHRYVFYEHLRQDSITPQLGQRVRAGQPLARVGRSGINSSGPHLHLHMADRPALLHAQGQPFVLSAFRQLGTYAKMDQAESGRLWIADPAAPAGQLVSGELPAPNAVLRFEC